MLSFFLNNKRVINKGYSFINQKTLFSLIVYTINVLSIMMMYEGNAFTSSIGVGFDQKIYIFITIVFHSYFLKKYITPLYLNHISKKWIRILAEIEKYSIWKIKIIDKATITKYFPDILYKYKIGNNIYENNSISFHVEKVYEDNLNYSNIDYYNLLYKNKTIEVLVNPLNHKQSVIIRDFGRHRYYFYAIMSLTSLLIIMHFFAVLVL